MHQLLRYMYLDTSPDLDEANAMEALHASKFFQIARLTAMCEASVKVGARSPEPRAVQD